MNIEYTYIYLLLSYVFLVYMYLIYPKANLFLYISTRFYIYIKLLDQYIILSNYLGVIIGEEKVYNLS